MEVVIGIVLLYALYNLIKVFAKGLFFVFAFLGCGAILLMYLPWAGEDLKITINNFDFNINYAILISIIFVLMFLPSNNKN